MCDSSSSDICLDTTERNINNKLNNLVNKKKPSFHDNNSDIKSTIYENEISELKADILKILLLIKNMPCSDSSSSHISTPKTSSVNNENSSNPEMSITNTTSEHNTQIEQLKSDVDDKICGLKHEIESLRKTVQSVFCGNSGHYKKK